MILFYVVAYKDGRLQVSIMRGDDDNEIVRTYFPGETTFRVFFEFSKRHMGKNLFGIEGTTIYHPSTIRADGFAWMGEK